MTFQHDTANLFTCTIKLATGRSLKLYRLDQTMTYAGMIEGLPSEQLNDDLIEWSLKSAQKASPNHPPYLIKPVKRSFIRTPGDCDHARERFSGPAEFLPNVRCIGAFSSQGAARDKTKPMSLLTVVWFQDEYGLPTNPELLEQLRMIDWDNLAEDGDY